MGFIMDGLDAEAYDRSYSDRQLLRRLHRYFRPNAGRILFVALLIVLNAGTMALIPVLTARGIDTVTSQSLTGAAAFQATGWLLAFMLAAAGLAWTFNCLRQMHTARVVGAVVLAVREDAFGAVMARDMSFYDEFSSGRIVSRVTSDTYDFSNTVTLTLNMLSQLLIVLIVFVIVLDRKSVVEGSVV